MIYRESLVMRKALIWFAVIVLAIIVIVPSSGNNVMGSDGLANAGGWLAAIFAAIFGVALGNGSREAARVFWVLPAPRWMIALQVIAVDVAGTTVAFAFVYLLMLAFGALHFRMVLSGTIRATDIAMALAMAYATYGWSALIGVLGRRMAYGGILAFPALMIWMILAMPQSPVGAILRVPVLANPFVVYNAALHAFTGLQWLGTTWTTPVLAATAVATCGIAIALWQRAEVIA